MSTYKFKMGTGANAAVIFEDPDSDRFSTAVAAELDRLPPGLPISMRTSPTVELPDGAEIVGPMQIRRWLAGNS